MLCRRHACGVLEGYVRDSANAKAPTSSIHPVPFGLASIANFDQSDLSAVCLRSTDGSCFFFAIGTIEAWNLVTVLAPESKDKQAVSYEAIAAVATSLGAVLDHVVIDDVAEDAYHAKLKILQKNDVVSVDVRPSDAIAMALTANVPIHVAPTALSAAVEHAARGQWWLPLSVPDSRVPSVTWWSTKRLKCDSGSCAERPVARVYESRSEGPTADRLLCKSHVGTLIGALARECAEVKPKRPETGAAEFWFASVITIRGIDVGDIYLRATDGSCFSFSVTNYAAWTLGSLLDDSKPGSRPLTHEVMADVIRRLGGALRDVVIDEPVEGKCHATLNIVQYGTLVSVMVRPCDAVALSLAINTPIHITPTAMHSGARRASQKIREMQEAGSNGG
jgi:bifunctional DNase/RNase